MDITISLTEEQSNFLMGVAREVDPDITEAQVADFIRKKFREFVKDFVLEQIERVEPAKLNEARARVKAQAEAKMRAAQMLFRGEV